MRKTTLKFFILSMFLLTGTWITGQTSYSVTFKVDMAGSQDFNPATDDVYISGTFADWAQPGTNEDYKMSLGLQIKVYELTLEIDSGEIEYKYFFVRGDSASWNHGEWDGGDNRRVTVLKDTIFFNNWGVMPSGIFNSKATARYKMYPNPVNDLLNISDLDDVRKIEIIDVSGKQVKNFNVESNRVSVNTSDLNRGVYFVRFYTESGIQTSKFVKD